MAYGFIIDNRKCIGCHACTVACKAEHDTPIGVNRTWVKYIEKGTFPNSRRHFSVMRCNHCADAPCVAICPVTALFTREDGIVDFDKNRCIGCKACTQACPYDAIYIDPETNTAAKCNYCAHRVEVGMQPACVTVCPEHAIIAGDMDDPDSEISQLLSRRQVTVRKPEKGTNPRLFYIEGDRVSLEPTATSQQDSYMWSSQASGVGHFARFAEERLQTGTESAEVGKDSAVDGDWLKAEESRDEVLVPASTDAQKVRKKAEDVLRETGRRAYDSPSKGVLWGWEVVAYLFAKAVAAGVFFVPVLIAMIGGEMSGVEAVDRGAALALGFLLVTGLLLIRDLDRPGRFLYVMLRPQWKSWLVKGAYCIAGYGVLLGAWLAAAWSESTEILSWLLWPTLVMALLTAVYTAFLFGQAKGRDFWQSPVLALHMLTHSLLAGCAVTVLLTWVGFLQWPPAPVDAVVALAGLMGAGVVLNLMTLAIELITPHPTEDAKTTASSITGGRFSKIFWFGVVVAGNVVPLASLLAGFEGAVAVAAVLILIGVYLVEDIWVRAPQEIPLS